MPAVVSLVNYAESLTPVNTPTAQVGYLSSDCLHPVVAHSFLAVAGATNNDFDIDLGSSRIVDSFYFFDVKGLIKLVPQIVRVELYYDTSALFAGPVLITTVTPNARGDGGTWGFGQNRQYFRIRVVCVDGTDPVRVGLFWLGPLLTLPKQFATMMLDPQRGTIVNETEGGGVFTTRRSAYRHRVELSWPAIKEITTLDALKVITDTTDGAYNPFCMAPDPVVQPELVFHGRVDDSFVSEQDGSTIERIGYRFTESGRGL